MIPQLYRPTNDEITAVIAFGLTKHRGNHAVISRMDRAAAILRDWTLYAEVIPEHRHLTWRVPSQAHPHERHYQLPDQRGQYCTCPDYERGDWQRTHGDVPGDRARLIGSGPGAPKLGHQLWCKHRMAVSAYLRILAEHLAGLLRADTLDLASTGDRTILLADGLPVCDIQPPTAFPHAPCGTQSAWGPIDRVHFATHYDAASFSIWLAGQRLPAPHIASQEEPACAAWPPQGHLVEPEPASSSDWQPTMTTRQMQRWLETGDLICDLA